jgi:hypothetical protein
VKVEITQWSHVARTRGSRTETPIQGPPLGQVCRRRDTGQAMSQENVVSRRSALVLLVALAVGLLPVASAAAVSASSDGRVFRFRASPGDGGVFIFLEVSGPGLAHFHARTRSLAGAPGCDVSQDPVEFGFVQLLCPLQAPVVRRSLRYRLSLADGNDVAHVVDPPLLRGVIYAGPGGDEVVGDRVVGGRGDDSVEAATGSGGAGHDNLAGRPLGGQLIMLRGGSGDDGLVGPGWSYGGPGNDRLVGGDRSDSGVPGMLVGGPGRDRVIIEARAPLVVRLRGGGADSVSCLLDEPAPRRAVIFADESDRISSDCRGAHIRLTGRPHAPKR